jgi:hypothetical protein
LQDGVHAKPNDRHAATARRYLPRRAASVNVMNGAVDWVSWMYLATNTLRILFYAPQIRAVFRAEDGASSVSIITWGFWTFANFTAALYGWLVIHDEGFTAIFAGNLVCTAAVTLIASIKRMNTRALP